MPKNPRAASPVIRLFKSVFCPPFCGLPIAIWIYFAWCFFVHPDSAILHGNLPDSDDYTYLNQVNDWLNGQGWFDNTQHRLAGGTVNHFSRITELPMAMIEGVFRFFMPPMQAALAMAAIWPLFLFGVFLIALRWAAEPLLNKDWTRFTSFIVLFATYLVYQFSSGRVDHHGLTAILIITAFGFTLRTMQEPKSRLWPALAGLCMGYGLNVALEILPSLIGITAWLGAWALMGGKKHAHAVVSYGATLFGSSLLFLILTVPMGSWLTLNPLVYSSIYVMFTAAIAIEFTVIAASSTLKLHTRWAIAGIVAAIFGIAFLYHFPSLSTGPYGAMNKDLARLMFTSITEAQPIFKPGVNILEIALRLIWPLMALAAAIFLFRRTRSATLRWSWGLLIALLAGHLLLASFYQIRFTIITQLFCIIPLAAYMHYVITWLGKNSDERSRVFLELGLLFAIAPLPMLVLPAIVNNSPLRNIILFPVVTADFECDMQSLSAELMRRYDGKPQLILNEMESGPELLFRTPYTVLGAPYHTNVRGNLEAAKFFGAHDMGTAENVLNKHAASYVTLCKKVAPLYPADTDGTPSLITELVGGHTPHWLKPIHYKGEGDYLLFEATY